MGLSTGAIKGRASGLSALRSMDFRLYWVGYVVSVSGQQMLWVAQGWLIYELTGSKLLLGAAGLAQAVPATVLTFFGGVVADRVDQRRLLIAVQLIQTFLVAVLAALCLFQVVQVWHILAVAFAMAATGSFEQPARHAMFPHLVERRALMSAVALNSTVHPGTRILGPAVAGIVLAQVTAAAASPLPGAATVFSMAALGYATYAVFLRLVRLPTIRHPREATVLQDMAAGLQFIWRNHVFAFLIAMTYFNNFFALSSFALLPVFAKDILHVGPSGLGFLHTAAGIGSLSGAAILTILGNSRQRGWLMIGGMTAQGAFLVLFALSSAYSLSLALLALSGVSGSLFNVAAQSTLQQLVPNEFRGRVMGIWGLTHSSVHPLGEMQMGVVAALFSAPFAVALGAGLAAAFALLVAAPNRRIRELGDPSQAEMRAPLSADEL